MGLLDDAIRDHLDLKRRRGADPADIERAEQEALGPVRRDPLERGPDDFESVPLPDDGQRAYDREEEQYDDEAYEEYEVEEQWEGDFEDQPVEREAPQLAADEAPEAREGELGDPTRLMDHEALDEPERPVADAPAPTSHETEAGAGDETMQYDVEEALAAETAPADLEPEADWVEDSGEWEEPSHEHLEPSHEPLEPPPADKAPTFDSPVEPEAPPQDRETDPAEPGVEPDPRADRSDAGTPAGETKGDDVLEETPEFLQDTPDHDRLWFEQRPPRDFDFDD
jgi:hypothetical protein